MSGRGPGQRAVLAAIAAYRVALAPMLGGGCKYHPSCSNYAQEAVERYGAARGAWLALRRLLRCRPFCAGGYDPVPESWRGESAASQHHPAEESAP